MMSRAEIVAELQSRIGIEIFELTDEYVIFYDEGNATDTTIRFAESYTKEDLKAVIHISPSVPPELRPNVDALVDYLWEVMDHYAFLTLNGLWYIYSDEDYRTFARFHGYEDGRLLQEANSRGCMWFDRQVCIVDARRVRQWHPDASLDHIHWDLIMITLHELRHLMMDTNPTLPAEEYPPELGSELKVRQFAWDLCEEERIAPIFS